MVQKIKNKKQPNEIILDNGKIEKWIDLKDYEGLYQISNTGKFWSIKSGKFLKIFIHKKYQNINITDNTGKRRQWSVSRLVALHFNENIKNDSTKVINHIDHNKLNNNINNLESITYSENSIAYYKFKGNEIIQYDLKMNFIKEWKDSNEIIEYYKKQKFVKVSLLSAISKKISYKGYRWDYKVNRTKKKHTKIYNIELFQDEEFKNIGIYKGHDLSKYRCST